MEERIMKFYSTLMICGHHSTNQKEQGLIDNLLDLLDQTQAKKELDQRRLDCARHKISNVACFSEKYGEIVTYLTNYQPA
ncbi:hypothetical protein ACFLZX_01410 [Nanoarchaeota archaeon]